MLFPAARMLDMHVCPMQTPALPPIPHVGGPIMPLPNTVLIGNFPAATVGQPCICVGSPDAILTGSATVLMCNTPAARMTSFTAHGGTVIMGWPTVLVGG